MQPGAKTVSAGSPTDRECLEAWRRGPSAEKLRPLLERYGTMVYASALRYAGDSEKASEITRAVFLVLARRARKLPKKTVLAGWLFSVTALACRKTLRSPHKIPWWRFVWRRPRLQPSPDVPWWNRISPQIDPAIQRLPKRVREAILLRVLLNQDWGSVVETLGSSESRTKKRVQRGLRKISHRLRKQVAAIDTEILAEVCSRESCNPELPEGLAANILDTIQATVGRRPKFKPARRTLNALAWARWRRRFAIGVPTSLVLLAILGVILWRVSARSGHSRFISEFVYWMVTYRMATSPAQAEEVRPWPTKTAGRPLDVRTVRSAQELYQTTNIWLAHLSFTPEQWKALEPRRIGPMPNFARQDGMWLLRNPKARRSGLLGVLGFEHDWSRAQMDFDGIAFTNVGVRVKGNAGSLYRKKPPFKVDLNKFSKGQKLAGLDELTFNNLLWDYSCLHDALGYEFFRDAGVLAPRTAYCWLSATVPNRWERKPLGLYLMLEAVDAEFAAERFGSKKAPVFKPVTYDFFKYLGNDWAAYEDIYDLKTQATSEQQRRLIDFARLVSFGSDSDFAAQVGGFLDLDEFARFLASLVLLSSYDGILSDGQNFYMYLDPRSNKFGFVPWDLDSAWGAFWLGSRPEMERTSIWHPWVGQNRFLERVMQAEEFRQLYRAHLEDFLARLFVPARLHRRIDELAALLHEPVGAESAFRLNKFEQSIGMKPLQPNPGEAVFGPNRPVHELKRFIEGRARSVRLQLDGKSKGLILPTQREK